MGQGLFSHVKDSVPISEFVKTLPQTKGLHSTGAGRWRCNNVISGGSNTNSMTLDDNQGFFKVFSHGQEQGDVITLYQLTLGGGESSSPKEAAIGLASHMGVHLDESMTQSQSFSPVAAMTKTMNAVMEKTHDYLVKSKNEDAVLAREYLSSRKMEDYLIDEWHLGLFPSDDRECRKMLQSCGSDSTLSDAGLLGGRRGDFIAMKGRLGFPILSRKGDCLSFSSRTVPGVDCALEDQKYINTTGTAIYDKSETLYGQHLLKSRPKNAVICEGNFDVIALNELVDDDTVALATCGSAMTEKHVSMLMKLKVESIIVAFDSDDAGRRASARLLWIANHSTGFTIAEVPGGKDPWDLYESGGELWDIYSYEPPQITSARFMHDMSKDRDEFVKWLEQAYLTLNYSEDREVLLNEAARLLGAKESVLRRTVAGRESKTVRSERSDSTVIEVTPQVKLVASALMSFDLPSRRAIAFSLNARATRDAAMDYCGASSDDDREILSIVMGKRGGDQRVSSFVYSLLPSDDEKEHVIDSACRALGVSILSDWRMEGCPKGSRKYISALNSISSGTSAATDFDKMVFLFEIAAR